MMTNRHQAYLVAIFALTYDIKWFIVDAVLASRLCGPDLGAVLGRGCSGVIENGAGRVGDDAFNTAAETPEGQRTL